MKVKNNLKNPQLNVENDIGWLFGVQVLIRKSQKCKNKFSQKIFRETLMVLDTDPILAFGLVVQKDLIHSSQTMNLKFNDKFPNRHSNSESFYVGSESFQH